MAVAEMPGDADQMLRIVTANFQQRLRRRHDLDQPAIIEHQRVSATQRDRILEVQQEFKPARARHRHSPPVAIIEVEHDGIGWRLAPVMLTPYLRGADHK
jgi:hypothetical protein